MNPNAKAEQSFIWPDDPNFKGFPKHLPDDCVEYTIHVLDSSLTAAALRSHLLQIQRASEKLQRELLRDYIWQREAFELKLSTPFGRRQGTAADPEDAVETSNGLNEGEGVHRPSELSSCDLNEVPLHLRGRTSFGDSLADEWLVVFLLKELSKQFHSAWIRVWDSDGEFLLIEAANVLPSWLNPEVGDNRVWLHDGKILLLPLRGKEDFSSAPKRSVTLKEAIAYLEQHVQSTTNPAYSLIDDPKLNIEAFHRIRNYPKDIRSNLHTSIVTIPRKLAYLIHRHPQWVSPAIEAFYLRDPIALKPLQALGPHAQQDLTFAPYDFVDAPLTFQRVGFAQLRGQEFPAPKTWLDIEWPDPQDDADASSAQRRRDAGLKLTCGFEMLLDDPQNQGLPSVRGIKLLLEDLEAGDEELPNDAEFAEWRSKQKEDSEDWLDVSYEELERTLNGRGAAAAEAQDESSTATKGVKLPQTTGDNAAQENLRRMVQLFEDFLKDEEGGGIDGVEDDDAEGRGMEETSHDESEPETSASETDDDDGPEFSEAQLTEMIDEMRKMGLKPPPAHSDGGDEIRQALLALSDFRAPDIAATKRVDTKATAKARAAAAAAAAAADSPSAPDNIPSGVPTVKDIANPHSNGTTTDKRPLWADPDPISSDSEIEELPPSRPSRNTATVDSETSSDDGFEGGDPINASPEEIQQLQAMIEAELRQAGALDRDSGGAVGGENDSRYGLAKNLLESFKGQAGLAGPAGNMMGLMGVGLPRDEDDDDEDEGQMRGNVGDSKGVGTRRSNGTGHSMDKGKDKDKGKGKGKGKARAL